MKRVRERQRKQLRNEIIDSKLVNNKTIFEMHTSMNSGCKIDGFVLINARSILSCNAKKPLSMYSSYSIDMENKRKYLFSI